MILLDYKNESPLHEQISKGIKELIISGNLMPDEKLPSVRELSVELTVNPNTVQRAYKELETEGMIYSIRGKGNFVSHTKGGNSEKTAELYKSVETAVRELCFLGEPEEKVLKTVTDIYTGKE